MPLDIDSVRAHFPGRRIVWLESCGSTMIEAARLAAGGCPSGTAVGADQQTAGVGRFGRHWLSERDVGLYVSLVLRLPLPEDSVRLLAMALGLSTAEAIARAADVACDLRWPNDVLVNDRKCAGILVHVGQVSDLSCFVAGIGINVNQPAFPDELAPIATSLRLATGRVHAREPLLIHLLESADSFTKMLVEGGKEPVLRMFARASSYVRGKPVIVEQGHGTIEGITDGLDPSGFLFLRRADGTRVTIVAGGVRPAGEGNHVTGA